MTSFVQTVAHWRAICGTLDDTGDGWLASRIRDGLAASAPTSDDELVTLQVAGSTAASVLARAGAALPLTTTLPQIARGQLAALRATITMLQAEASSLSPRARWAVAPLTSPLDELDSWLDRVADAWDRTEEYDAVETTARDAAAAAGESDADAAGDRPERL
jgi:hypothetical protein